MCSSPFIVMSAPNGARRDKTHHPLLPMTPDEIADCAESVLREGASMLHVHVRDKSGAHSLDPKLYKEAIRAIRERVGDQLIVQITTEAGDVYTPEQQMDVVRKLRPEAVSIALREICPDPGMAKKIRDFSRWLRDNGIMVQYILHTPDDVSRFSEMRDRSVLGAESRFVLFVLGSYSMNIDGLPQDIQHYRSNLADESVSWAVCCFGRHEDKAAASAAVAAGHARVGFENNLYGPDGTLASDNASQIRSVAEHGRKAGRSIADADNVRALFAC